MKWIDTNKVALKKVNVRFFKFESGPWFCVRYHNVHLFFYNLNLKFENILPNWTLILCPPWCLFFTISIHIQFIYSNFYLHFLGICLQKFIFMEFWITYIIAVLQWFLVWCFCFKITKNSKIILNFYFLFFSFF